VKLRIRRRAKKELLDVDDDAIFFALVKAMLNLGENPRPRGCDKVEGAGGVYRVWVGRDWRLLYSIDQDRSELVIEAGTPDRASASRSTKLDSAPAR
jgi:mRNA-degrading endonuclease RelE of RelBE toxin-antitoxin system